MKLPLDFGIKLFFRLLLPGFLVTLGLLPILMVLLELVGFRDRHEVAFVICMIVAGWMIVSADMPIYMLVEGRHGWPSRLKRVFTDREIGRLERINAAIDSFYAKPSPAEGLRREYLEASVKKRSFPIEPASGERYVEFPTRLGNAIHAFETYSKVMYGIEAVFYWPRIWVNLSKDLREEIDTQQAMADSTVYSSFALGVSGLLWVFYSVFCVVQALIARFLAWVGVHFSLPPGILAYLPEFWNCVVVAMIFVASAYGVYRLSVYTNEQFGVLFMAIVDSHAGKIQKDFVDIGAIVTMVEKLTRVPANPVDKLEIARRYLQYYTVKLPGVKRPVAVPKVETTLQLGDVPEGGSPAGVPAALGDAQREHLPAEPISGTEAVEHQETPAKDCA